MTALGSGFDLSLNSVRSFFFVLYFFGAALCSVLFFSPMQFFFVLALFGEKLDPFDHDDCHEDDEKSG